VVLSRIFVGIELIVWLIFMYFIFTCYYRMGIRFNNVLISVFMSLSMFYKPCDILVLVSLASVSFMLVLVHYVL
jgi:uncharacterized membrane protein